MWLFYEIEAIFDSDYQEERITPLVFNNYEDIITFGRAQYEKHTQHYQFHSNSSKINIPDTNTLDNIQDGDPYTFYQAYISDRVFSGFVVKLRNYQPQTN